MEIFDKDTKRWFRVKRGWFGRLILQEFIYTQITRFPGSNDLVYSDCEGLNVNKPIPLPKQYQIKKKTSEKDG